MPITTLVLIIYLLILALITYISYSKVNHFSDFFIARKRGNLFTITGSLIATILGGSAIIGTINEGRTLGWATSWYMLSASIGLFALIPLAGRVSKTGRYTLPGMLGDFYNPKVKLLSSWIISIAWIGIISAQIIAAAYILQSFTNLNYVSGVILSGAVFIIYTLAGGQLSVLKTDFFQSILIVAGLGIIVYFTSKIELVPLANETPIGFPFNKNFSPIDLFVLLITYSTTFTFGPDIYTRIFCARNEKIAKQAVFIAAVVLIPVAFSIGYISVTGSYYLQIPATGSLLIELCKLILPLWAVAIIVVSLLSAVLSSADTTILSTSAIITDLIQRGNFGDQTIRISRTIIVIVGISSIVIALNFTSIIGILLIALTAYSGAFILPLLAAILGIKINQKVLIPALITGGLTALTGKIIYYSGQSAIGNWVIISSFLINGGILIWGWYKKNRIL
jgi:SSS family solute:Na+ symporter